MSDHVNIHAPLLSHAIMAAQAFECAVRFGDAEELLARWELGQRPCHRGNVPAATILAIAWREAGEANTILLVDRAATHGRTRSRTATAVLLVSVFSFVVRGRVAPDQLVQIVALDTFDAVDVAIVEQSPRPAVLPATRG